MTSGRRVRCREIETLDNTSLVAVLAGVGAGAVAEVVPTDNCVPCYLPCLNSQPSQDLPALVGLTNPELCSYCANTYHTC